MAVVLLMMDVAAAWHPARCERRRKALASPVDVAPPAEVIEAK